MSPLWGGAISSRVCCKTLAVSSGMKLPEPYFPFSFLFFNAAFLFRERKRFPRNHEQGPREVSELSVAVSILWPTFNEMVRP